MMMMIMMMMIMIMHLNIFGLVYLYINFENKAYKR